eukprot:8024576-Pyramimonas_sp.AAC.1
MVSVLLLRLLMSLLLIQEISRASKRPLTYNPNAVSKWAQGHCTVRVWNHWIGNIGPGSKWNPIRGLAIDITTSRIRRDTLQ